MFSRFRWLASIKGRWFLAGLAVAWLAIAVLQPRDPLVGPWYSWDKSVLLVMRFDGTCEIRLPESDPKVGTWQREDDVWILESRSVWAGRVAFVTYSAVPGSYRNGEGTLAVNSCRLTVGIASQVGAVHSNNNLLTTGSFTWQRPKPWLRWLMEEAVPAKLERRPVPSRWPLDNIPFVDGSWLFE